MEDNENKLNVKTNFDLNKLPNDSYEVSFDQVEDSLHNVDENENENEELAFPRVEDSLDSANETENENEETIFRGKRKSRQDVDLSENNLLNSNGVKVLTSSDCNNKKVPDLNKFPDEGHDFGFECEALNDEVLNMVKIYLDRFY
ncbi:hypothetical protein SESBI_30407 [Sesbania bispinosa]|nr:hypothetical protein SESBI_30407 [Sesbania bispinosa]